MVLKLRYQLSLSNYYSTNLYIKFYKLAFIIIRLSFYRFLIFNYLSGKKFVKNYYYYYLRFTILWEEMRTPESGPPTSAAPPITSAAPTPTSLSTSQMTSVSPPTRSSDPRMTRAPPSRTSTASSGPSPATGGELLWRRAKCLVSPTLRCTGTAAQRMDWCRAGMGCLGDCGGHESHGRGQDGRARFD